MNKTIRTAKAVDGISRTFYLEEENGMQTMVLGINVQYAYELPDAVLELVQMRIQDLSQEIMSELESQ